MLKARKPLVRTAKQICRRQQRRFESSSSGHGAPHHGSHPEPVNESLGRGFYVAVAVVPLTIACYTYTRSSENSDPATQPFLTRFIGSYDSWNKTWEERNTLHTDMLAQAAHDRNLFQGAKGSPMIELRFPEIFNTGSPFNVPAGHQADVSQVVAHYQNQNAETAEKVRAKGEARKNSSKNEELKTGWGRGA